MADKVLAYEVYHLVNKFWAKPHHVGMKALDDVDMYATGLPQPGCPEHEQQEELVVTPSTIGLAKAKDFTAVPLPP